jgi:hypothetical protein
MRFRIVEQAPGYHVFFTADGEARDAPLALDLGSQTELARKLANLREDAATLDDINYIGVQLWLALCSGAIDAAARRCYTAVPQRDTRIVLEVPDTLLYLPWESLYERSIGGLALTESPAYCIVHLPVTEGVAWPLKPASSPLTMLILAPENSGLAVALEIEVIERHTQRAGIKPKVIQRAVTQSRIYDELRVRAWDIVHFIGHGRVSATQRLELELNTESGDVVSVDAEIISNSFQARGVRLAVFNCCRSAGVEPRADPLSGLGPLMMRRGVPAVVSMRYDILDSSARRFSNAFYHQLLNGPRAGYVDVAANLARGAMSRDDNGDAKGYITPVLHLAPAYQRLFELAAGRGDDPVDPQPPENRSRRALPAPLLQALRDQRCVPVVGPGILRADALRRDRDTISVLDPAELIGRLARNDKRPYPRPRDLNLYVGEPYPDWISFTVFQRICQSYVDETDGWNQLVETLHAIYANAAPNAMLSKIARIRAPGLFYTWIDGQLHDATVKRQSSLDEVVWLFDQRMEVSPEKYEGLRKPLVLVRGSIHDRCRLVLTEGDHERVAQNIGRMSRELVDVARGWQRCVLFIGVSPREPLVRQLAQQLLERPTPHGQRIQAAPYFICPDHDSVDASYWRQYGMNWIDGDSEAWLDAVLEAAS